MRDKTRMTNFSRQHFFNLTCVFFFFFLLVLFFTQRINLTTADLGRHIQNGRLFFEQSLILHTNYYSYTEPDFPTITHHWGAGIIFYLIWKWSGFFGISLFYTALLLGACGLFFHLARRVSGFHAAFIFFVISLPLIVSRVEIRPEGFSALLLGIYFLLMYSVKLKRIPFKILWCLPLLQIFWTNLHIFFVFGPFLIFLFLIDHKLQKEKALEQPRWGMLFIVSMVVCLINPFGMEGVLTPFLILKEYGYMLAENQSVFFMQKRFPNNPLYLHYEVVFAFFILLMTVNLFMKKGGECFIAMVTLVFFSVLAFKSVRAVSLFGFFFVPCGAVLYQNAVSLLPVKWKKYLGGSFFILSLGMVLIGLIGKKNYYSPYEKLNLPFIIKDVEQSKSWVIPVIKNMEKLPGLLPKINDSALFFKNNNLKGPVFNNYDIGGYLIYHLYPRERFFVDNRPESYSVDFFQKTYIPMQSDEGVWRDKDAEYKFNCIYFYRHDITPWAQPFLIRRIQDPAWAPVYADWYTIILLKRNQANEGIIRKYELPLSVFKVSTR